MTNKNHEYNKARHSIALEHGISDEEINFIDRVQFEFLREKMKELKSVRLPNFAIFLLKTKFIKDGVDS